MHLPAYRYSQLDATNRCPTKGALTYGLTEEYGQSQHLSTEKTTRQSALDAGSASHEAYAAVRLWQAHFDEGLSVELFEKHGLRLFGEERFTIMKAAIEKSDDVDMKRRHFIMNAFYTAGYDPHPDEKKRTVANVEGALMRYIDWWSNSRPIWVDGDLIGIETDFDLCVEIDGVPTARYVGKIDGIHTSKRDPNKIVVEENKTGGYINQTWADAFYMSHQITGYNIAASLLAKKSVQETVVLGMQIPSPALDPVREEVFFREEDMYHQWIQWFIHSVDMFEDAKSDPIEAPKYACSCNQFFNLCEFIPFCAGDRDDKETILKEMKDKFEEEREEWQMNN